MNLLKTMTKALNEEDDMFPGLDASAFDEHNTKPKDLDLKGELDKMEKQAHELDIILAYAWKELMQLQHFLEKNKAMETGLSSTHDIRYREVEGMESKFPRAFKRLHGHFIKSDSPIIDELQMYIAKLERALEMRMEELSDQIR